MSSVINTNVTAIRTQNIYNRNNDYMSDAMRKVATGMKINSAKDNSSVWAITEKMKERIRANDQANQNIQNDTALLKTAEDGLGNTLDILKTLKERAINSANDSNISSDRSKIVEEVRQLAMQIDDNAAKVKFNGRQLLNGGVEATSGTSGVSSSAGTVSPQAVTATGTYADKAVYALTGFSHMKGDAIAGTSKLVELVGENGETLFQKGDQITFNWTDNGTQKTSTITVDASTALSSLNPGASSLSGAFVAAGATTGATANSGSTINASADGVYLTSTTAKHNISNLSIAVTTSTGATRTAAQDALTPTAVAQSYGNPDLGSNMVYEVAKTATTPRGDLTTLADLNVAKDSATANITINDVQLTFAGSTSLQEISDAFKQKGVDVEFHYVATAGDPVTYEGNTVTMGTYGSTATYGGAGNTSDAGLHVVGGSNQYIYKVDVGGTAGTKDLSLDDTGASGISSVTSPTLPQGGPLQFFVGGEQNFGVNFTLGKATVGNLLGGTADTFASKFQTKEGAESALGIIDTAISKVLTEQTKVGAMEARLGYTSDNIVSMNENLDAGVSAYRDTDMAKEMTNYMKYSVLSQASQYMLSQASQNAFSVLNLLQQ